MSLPESTLAWVHQGLSDSANQPNRGCAAAFRDLLRLVERPLPKLGFGKVLIRVDAAPVNPSDRLFVRGDYGIQPKIGDVPGFEGCGTVLAANAGPYGWWLKGKRVSFGEQGGNGSWSQYVVASAFECIPVDRRLPVEATATLIVNPMTAIGLLTTAKRHGARAIVANAAGSALGKFLIPLAKQQRVDLIALVRREANREPLLSLGATEVLNTSSADFMSRFTDVCKQRQATVLLDAVAGTQTAMLMKAMPSGSLAIVYGKLDDQPWNESSETSPVAIDVDGLVFRKQRVEGYWLTHELHGLNGIFTPLLRARIISQLYRQGTFAPGTFTTTTLENLVSCLDTEGVENKVLFKTTPNTQLL